MSARLGSAAVIAAITLVLPGVCSAQDYPAGNVSVNYAALKDSDADGWFPKGWSASAAGALTRSFELVAEVGANYKTERAPEASIEVRGTLFTYMGGVRYVARPQGRVSGFVQGLAGAARVSVSMPDCGPLPQATCDAVRRDMDDSATTLFAIQPGAGVDVALAKHVGLRVQVDYRAVFPNGDFEDAETMHEFRFGAGVVFTFGSRR